MLHNEKVREIVREMLEKELEIEVHAEYDGADLNINVRLYLRHHDGQKEVGFMICDSNTTTRINKE